MATTKVNVSKISDFPKVTPAGTDQILVEKDGQGGSITLSQIPVSTPVSTRIAGEVNTLNSRIDNIVASSGDDISEIVDARQGSDGTNYASLRARLDAENNQLKGDLVNISEITRNLVEDEIEDVTVYPDGVVKNFSGINLCIAKVVQNTTYCLTTDQTEIVIGFFETKPTKSSITYNQSRTVITSKVVTSPIDGYIAFSISNEYKFAQIEVGTKSTEYIKHVSAIDEILRESFGNIDAHLSDVENKITNKFDTCKNLFDKTKITDGYYTVDGKYVNPDGINGATTDYITVNENDVIRFTQFSIFGTNMKGAMFDADRNFVGAISVNNCPDLIVNDIYFSFSIPANVSYIRLSLIKTNLDYILLTKNTDYTGLYSGTGMKLNESVKVSDDNIFDYSYLIQCFRTIGVVGDSLASGESISNETGTQVIHDLYEHSWLQYMARYYGFTGINFSIGGLDTKSWFEHENGKIKAETVGNECECYIIGLGANDMKRGSSYLGSVSDIGTDNITFYGRYSKIISTLKNVQPKAKFFLLTLSNNYTNGTNAELVESFNNAIRYISNNTENCYLIDLSIDDFMYNSVISDNLRAGHYNALCYNIIGMHLAKLIGNYMYEHQEEFRQIEFIGTDYEWN